MVHNRHLRCQSKPWTRLSQKRCQQSANEIFTPTTLPVDMREWKGKKEIHGSERQLLPSTPRRTASLLAECSAVGNCPETVSSLGITLVLLLPMPHALWNSGAPLAECACYLGLAALLPCSLQPGILLGLCPALSSLEPELIPSRGGRSHFSLLCPRSPISLESGPSSWPCCD